MNSIMGAGGSAKSAPVRLSLVVAMYRVEAYLADFLNSLAEQDTTGIEVEYVFVDDGSPQDEARLAEEWLAKTGSRGQVLRKQNGGVSSARNFGLEHATGEWVSFPDPDDILAPRYLREIADYLGTPGGERADVVTARIVFFHEETGETKDTHPLNFKFEAKPKNLSLRRLPHVIHVHTSTGFIRRKALLDAGLRFDENLALGEDAVLLGRLFGTVEFPVVGVVPGAVYLYRKRAAKDSALDSRDPQGMIDRLRLGYLPLIRDLAASGRLYEWAAHLALYDLGWLYKQELSMTPLSASMTAAQRADVLGATKELLALFPEEWLYTSLRPAIPDVIRTLWSTLRDKALGVDIGNPVGGSVRIALLDGDRKLLQLKYHFTGAAPTESILVGGLRTEPTAAKTRTIEFFGQRVLFERILWVAATSSLRVLLDGRLHPLAYSESTPAYSVLRAEVWKHFGKPYPASLGSDSDRSRPFTSKTAPARPAGRPGAGVRGAAARLRRRGKPVWIFMDRVDMAQDNAEHLYRHVRRTRPGVDAWFVLDRASHDWDRLRREGFKLAAFRSDKHVALLLAADHVISSHADIEMTDPVPASYYPDRRRPWKFTFLQHGVIKDDLSRWLNRKPVSTFVTTTRAEYESIAGEETPYVFTSKEVVLTGLPRHDALLRKVAECAREGGERFVVIAPTWRNGLLAPKKPFEPRQLVDGFRESPYAMNWNALLTSENLRAAVRASGRRLVFLPHPTMEQFAGEFAVPEDVRTVRYADGDVQQLLARTDLLITDYSSLAFDAAFAGAPTVYYHFDAQSIYAGEHTYMPGYFDYERDGFGPVATSVQDVVDASRDLLHGSQTGSPYQERIAGVFAHRDGRASERVVQAIIASRPGTGSGRRPRMVRLAASLRRRRSIP